MDARQLQDKVAKGMGRAAARLGSVYTVYRPNGPLSPTCERNRVIRLPIVFQPAGGTEHARSPVVWYGVMDSFYARQGDYFVGAGDTFFLATQPTRVPLTCVLTNSVVTIVRPSFAAQGAYSGFQASDGSTVILSWPGNLAESGSAPEAVRAGQGRLSTWTLLLPILPARPQVADVVTDADQRNFVVGAVEENALGWRLLVRQIGA